MSQLAPDQVFDPAIDQSDTYVVTEAVVQQVLEVEGEPDLVMPTEERHTEMGYTASGQLVTSDYRLDTPGDPYETLVDEPRVVRAVGESGTIYDVNGQIIPSPPEYTFTPQQILNDEGLQVTDGLIVEEIADEPGAWARALPQQDAAVYGTPSVQIERKGNVVTVSSMLPASSGASKSKHTRTYKRRGDVYVLDEIQSEFEVEDNGRTAYRGKTRIKMRHISWRNNKQKDAERRGRRGQGWPTSKAAISEIPPPPCEPTDEGCSVGGGGGGNTSPDPCPPLAGEPALIFQHGIMSSGDAWLGGGNGVVFKDARCKFRTGSTVRHSMENSGFNNHASQIAELRSDVLQNTSTPLVFVGHSQGGVISRRLAQELHPRNATPTRPVRGLVTMDTPNSGAIGADVMRSAGMRFAVEGLRQVLGTPQGGGFVCLPGRCGQVVNFLAGTIGSGTLSWLNMTLWSADALPDLKQGSTSIVTMNQTYETFPRFAIRSAPKARWMFARLAGDNGGKRKGDDWVRHTSVIHAWAVTATVLAAFWHVWPVFRCFGSFVLALNTADLLSYAIGGGFGRYDGIVTYGSQQYPTNAPGQYPPVTRNLEQRPVSHVGVQSSEEASERAQDFFRAMGLVPR